MSFWKMRDSKWINKVLQEIEVIEYIFEYMKV